MQSSARFCFKHRWLVLAAWIVALVIIGGAGKSLGTAYSSKFQLPHTDSVEAQNLLKKEFPAVSGSSDQIVIQANGGSVNDPAIQSAFQAMIGEIDGVPGVRTVVSPYSAEGVKQISKDGQIAFATVIFDAQAQDVPKNLVKHVVSIAKAAATPSMTVALGGNDIENVQKQSEGSSTAFGIIFALVVLVLAFGALLASILPIITALFAIGIGFSITGMLSHVFGIADFAPVLGLLIGLGVGVDYALFIVTRHRAGLKAGKSVEESVVQAVDTAGRAVFFAGLTVCIALLGQFVLGVSFLYGLAICASVTVLLTMLAALTLLPALLGFFGMKALSRRERKKLVRSGPEEEHLSGLWYRWARWIEGRAMVPGLIALLVVLVVAAPVFTMRLGLTDAGSDPSGSTTLKAYQLVAKGFGPGFAGPFQLVGELSSPSDRATFTHLIDAVEQVPGIAAVSPPRYNDAQTVAVANAYPLATPDAAQTTVLLHHLRNVVIPAAEAGSGVHVLVGGNTAIQVDFSHLLGQKLILFLVVIIALGFILLMAVFRSLIVPLMASVMNVLAAGATLGILNVLFEWGWGESLLKLSTKTPVEVFLPPIMISILFGLSMDYEVFLVSRIREEWVRRKNATEAVTLGQAATGRVITAAAAIMILVFASFALGNTVVIEQFGIGLAAAILVDAFFVRTALVPALMHLCGDATWWLPGWLDRLLPHLNIEGTIEATEPGEPALAGNPL